MYFVYWIIFVNEGVKTFCNHLSFFLCLDISARCLLLLGILTYHTMMSTGVLSFSDISFTYVCTRSSVRPLFLPHERAVKNVNRFYSNKQFMRDFLLCISTFILPNKKKKQKIDICEPFFVLILDWWESPIHKCHCLKGWTINLFRC